MSIAADSRIVLNLIGKVGWRDCIVLISQSGHCPSSNESETTPHMLISCSSLALVWSELQSFHPLNVDSVKDLLENYFDKIHSIMLLSLSSGIYGSAKTPRSPGMFLRNCTLLLARLLMIDTMVQQVFTWINKWHLTDWSTLLYHLSGRF